HVLRGREAAHQTVFGQRAEQRRGRRARVGGDEALDEVALERRSSALALEEQRARAEAGEAEPKRGGAREPDSRTGRFSGRGNARDAFTRGARDARPQLGRRRRGAQRREAELHLAERALVRAALRAAREVRRERARRRVRVLAVEARGETQ